MNIVFKVFLTFFVSLLFSNLYAASGSAIIPHFMTNPNSSGHYSYFFISNITRESVDVSIKFYDQAGNLITDDNNENAGYIRALNNSLGVSAYSEPSTDSSVLLTIKPHATGIAYLMNTSTEIGSGKIEWNIDNSDRRTAITAQGRSVRTATYVESAYVTTINGGNPF